MVNFDNRIIFDMGNWSEINYKISFAEQVIAEQPAEKEGYLVMVGTNQCSFRNKTEYEASRKKAKDNAKAVAEGTDQTDETSSTEENQETEALDDPGDQE